MAKFNGFGGGMGNMQNLLKQAQKMQADLQKKQDEVSVRTFEASAGGGAVKVICTGDKVIKDVIIQKDVVDSDDMEMLQDLIKAATNEVLSKVDSAIQDSMGSFNIPGLM